MPENQSKTSHPTSGKTFPPLKSKPVSQKQLRKKEFFKTLNENNSPKTKNVLSAKIDTNLSTFIHVHVNNQKLTSLLDTGASVCVCSPKLLNFILPADNKLVNLTTANNEPLKVIKKGFLSILINNLEFKIFVYATEKLSVPLILGNTFLEKFNAVINFPDRQISFVHPNATFSIPLLPKAQVNLNFIKDFNDSYTVFSQLSSVIPPLCERKIPIKCNLPSFITNYFFEPNPSLITDYGLFVNRQLLTEPYLLVKNPSYTDKVIFEGTDLGTVTFHKNLDYFPRTDRNQKSEIVNFLSSIGSRRQTDRDIAWETALPLNVHNVSTKAASTACQPSQSNALKMAGHRKNLISIATSRKIHAPRTADPPLCINRTIPNVSCDVSSHMKNYFVLNLEPKSEKLSSVPSAQPEACLTDTDGTKINVNPDLPPNISTQVKNILLKNIEVFASSQVQLKKARIMPAEIILTDTIPVHSPPFHLSPVEDEQLSEIIEQLKSIGVCSDSTSPYASPAFLVKKENVTKTLSTSLSTSDKRLVVDYRKLNLKVVPDKYPLPRIDTLITELRQNRYFSKFDFLSGFFQQELSKNSRKCTAFTTSRGLFEFNRQPMGIKNGSSSFSRALNRVFADLLYHGVIIFVDDLIIYSKDLETHLRLLNIVFERLKKHFLRLKTIKSQICCNSIDILGFVISHDSIAPSHKNLEPILKAKPPSSLKELRSFIGSCTFYRKFIHNFSKICSPLYDLLQTETEKSFQLTPDALHAFKTLISLFAQQPILKNFRENLETIVIVDSSKTATGSILAQRDPDTKKLHPIGYFSKRINPKPSWSVSELELQGLTLAVNHYRDFLYGRKFVVYSDHNSLEYFKNFKDKSSRLNKLVSKLIDYDFHIIYRKSSTPTMKAVDHLSRYPVTSISSFSFKLSDISEHSKFITEQKLDPVISKLRKAKIDPHSVSDSTIRRQARRFEFQNDLLYSIAFIDKQKHLLLYVPSSLVQTVLNHFHNDSGHLSFKKCYDRLKQYFYWPSIRKDLLAHISTCHSCKINKPSAIKYGLLEPIPPPLSGRPFTHVILDFLGPLPSSYGSSYILIAIDTLTKFAVTKATTSADALTVAKFLLNDVVTKYGFITYFSSDRGTHFDNELISTLCSQLKIVKQSSTAYRPQSQGLVERFNKTITILLRHYTNEDKKNWNPLVPFVTFSYNIHKQSSTTFSPFYLLHGYEADTSLTACLPSNHSPRNLLESVEKLLKVRSEVPALIKKTQQEYKKRYDSSRKPLNLSPGDNVYVTLSRPSSKLDPLYKGPFPVIKKLTDLNYEIKMPMRNKLSNEIIHVSRLKPATTAHTSSPPSRIPITRKHSI